MYECLPVCTLGITNPPSWGRVVPSSEANEKISVAKNDTVPFLVPTVSPSPVYRAGSVIAQELQLTETGNKQADMGLACW